MLKFLKILSVFTGTIIGVGIFVLPFVVSKAGFLPVVFYFLLLSIIAIFIHFIYGEVSFGTKELHRLPGYTREYLGRNWEKISILTVVLGLFGALLAYLIVGGEFLHLFLGSQFGGSPIIYTLLFFSFGSYLIFRGIKSISEIELSLLVIFFSIVLLFLIKALPSIDINYFKEINVKFLIFPYGVILFSLWGSAIVPEIKEMVQGDRKMLRKVITTGILISTFTYLLFIFIVFGTSGPNTSKEAISGLSSVLGSNIIRLGFLFGIITCFTSFLTLGLTLKKVFWYDLGLSKNLSWFIASFIPLFLFLLGIRKFIDIIGFTGAIAIGIEGVIIVFLYREFSKKMLSKKMNPLFYILPIFFILGVILEIFYFIWR
ncbi:MAG: hypothetical protein CMI54_04375 [Parcubacteria group bacterium]|nr:hypothetical protein [Parcubacteria group bacterium]|tara:strand:- start:30747 stop:31865 length:1119 start_codon:yes stop_codon:yes gene_type:complete